MTENAEEILTEKELMHISRLNSAHGYSFSAAALKNIAEEHKTADSRRKLFLEARLGDANYHHEAGLLAEGNEDALLEELRAEKAASPRTAYGYGIPFVRFGQTFEGAKIPRSASVNLLKYAASGLKAPDGYSHGEMYGNGCPCTASDVFFWKETGKYIIPCGGGITEYSGRVL